MILFIALVLSIVVSSVLFSMYCKSLKECIQVSFPELKSTTSPYSVGRTRTKGTNSYLLLKNGRIVTHADNSSQATTYETFDNVMLEMNRMEKIEGYKVTVVDK